MDDFEKYMGMFGCDELPQSGSCRHCGELLDPRIKEEGNGVYCTTCLVELNDGELGEVV